MNACNKCGSTDVTRSSEAELNTYKGTDYSVDIEYSKCGSCHREFLTKPQIISNEIKVRESKKVIDCLLSSEQVKAVRKSLNLSQTQASEVFGGGLNAFSKYERSEVTQSQAMDKLLRLASSDRYIYKKLLGLSSMENKAQIIASIDLPISSTSDNSKWVPSQFKISAPTQEFSGPKLKLVA